MISHIYQTYHELSCSLLYFKYLCHIQLKYFFEIGKIVNKLSYFKRGVPFTQEEDEIIKKRVLEWGDKGSGLWVSIQKELNRPTSNIIYRWNNRLNQDKEGQTFKQSKWKVQEVIMNDDNTISR